jgi:hypothetical protein
MSRHPIEIDPQEALQHDLQHLKTVIKNRIEEANQDPNRKPPPPPRMAPPPMLSERGSKAPTPPPPPKIRLSPLENLLEQTEALLENLENGEAFATAGKAFDGIISKLNNPELQADARMLLDPIDQHAAALKHPTHIQRDKRKVESTEAQLEDLKTKMGETLTSLDNQASAITSALQDLYEIDSVPEKPTPFQYLRSLLFEYRTRIPEEEREAAWKAALAFNIKTTNILNNIQDLTDPTQARKLLIELNNACEQFKKDYKKHKRSIDRVAFGEMLYAPLVSAADTILGEMLPNSSIKASSKTAIQDVTALTERFIRWETTPSAYQQEERKLNLTLLRENFSHIKTTAGDVSWSNNLTHAAEQLNTTLAARLKGIQEIPLNYRVAHFNLINALQFDLDKLINAKADNDEEACYTHASSLMETLEHAKTRIKTPEGEHLIQAIESNAYTVLYTIDFSTQKSDYPTEIQQEGMLRENVATTINNTQVIIDRLKDMGHPDTHPLIIEAKTFIDASHAWLGERRGASPTQREASNHDLIQAYEKFDGLLAHSQAQTMIRQNTLLEKAYNALVGGMNFFIRQVSPESQFETYSRKETMQKIKGDMQALKDTQKQVTPPWDDSRKEQNAFEKQRDACQTFITERRETLEQTIKEAETNINLGAPKKEQEKIIDKARAQLNSVKIFESCFRRIQDVDSTDPDAFLNAGSAFADLILKKEDSLIPRIANKQGKLVSDNTNLDQATKLIRAIESHATNLGKPVHIKTGLQFDKDLKDIIFQIEKEIIELESRLDKWYMRPEDNENNRLLIGNLTTLKLAIETFQASHKENRAGSTWVPDADSKAFKTLTDAYKAYTGNKDNMPFHGLQRLIDLVRVLSPSKQATLTAKLPQNQKNKKPPPPSTPAPTTKPDGSSFT